PIISLSCFLLLIPRPPSSPLFPYTTLFRSRPAAGNAPDPQDDFLLRGREQGVRAPVPGRRAGAGVQPAGHARRAAARRWGGHPRSEEHTSELQSRENLVCRLLLEKKKTKHA